VDTVGSGYTIGATSTGLTGATTTAFNVTPAAASKLVITTQPPSSVAANSGFGLVVSVEDPYGNVVTGDAGSVTLVLATNPGGATLGGILTVSISDGEATFSGLTLNKPAQGYKLKATSTGLTTATTDAITVT
jgi:hypothetical protein